MKQYYLGGKLHRGPGKALTAWNSGLTFGEAVFESLPVYGGEPLFLEDHLRRLRSGCDHMGWTMPRRGEFDRAIRLLFPKGRTEDLLVRFTMVLDEGVGSRKPLLIATTRPLRHDVRAPLPRRGQAGILPWGPPRGNAHPLRFKVPDYMATRRALRLHPGWEDVVKVDDAGWVVDGGYSTPLWFDGKKVHSPPMGLGGLQGVTRRRLLEHCRRRKMGTVERPWGLKDVLARGELVLVGSGIGVMVVSRLGGHVLHDLGFGDALWRQYRTWALKGAG